MHNALRAPVPALHRLLARLGETDVAAPAPSLTARLSQWLEWTQAVALSSALDARPVARSPDTAPSLALDASECARVRAALMAAIVGDRAFASAPGASGNDLAQPDASFFRQRYTALQQVMEADIGHLRGRLRGLMTQQAPELAPLAAMDAVMERALGRQERALLARLPEWLAQHFDRLRLAAAAAPDATSPSARWLDVFRQDMQSLLLAELDLRLQPSEGLVSALRTTVTP
ncbi:DUF3348 family protein [Lysobacter olei]